MRSTSLAAMSCSLGLLLTISYGSVRVPAQADPCPVTPATTIASASIPADVCVPQSLLVGTNPIDYFDDYSWRAFIALVWQAASGQRGVPDNAKHLTSVGSPRVFETLKATWEVFHRDGSAPADWNTYDEQQFNPCGVAEQFGGVTLASFSKFSDLGQAGFGSLVGPIVVQNRTYVRYQTLFNRNEFQQIQSNKWFRRENLPVAPQVLTFSNAALDVKAAWIDMANIPHPERYYTRGATVLDLDRGSCVTKTIGLIGLHIVQKTQSRPQWIWSSFEQVDNVPPAPGASAPAPMALNNGDGTAMPQGDPFPIDPPLVPTPAPFNVERQKLINAATKRTNNRYQRAVRDESAASPWQFYQLVVTQWPLVVTQRPAQPIPPAVTGVPANTFPGVDGGQTAFSNVTMETFDQMNLRTSCMNCHTQVKDRADFVWSLFDHAFQPNIPAILLNDPAIRQLQRLLQLNRRTTSLRSTPAAAVAMMSTAAQPMERATTSVSVLKTYADVQHFIDQVLTDNHESPGVASAPHKNFWSTMTYEQFVHSNVPNVTDPTTGREMPILVCGKSTESNLILSLRGSGPLFDPSSGAIGQMPANGPPMFTPEQIDAIAAWIDAGCQR